MIQRLIPPKLIREALFLFSPALASFTLLTWLHTGLIAQNTGDAQSSAAGSPMHVTHVLGLESISKNANGNLSIQANALQFQKDDGPAAKISIDSIQDVFLGEQDKQVGGLPMALGRAATPF